MKVGRHNALSGDTAPGRTGSSIDGEYSTPTLRLAMWPAWRVGKHKGAQTANGPSAHPSTGGPKSSLSDICRFSLEEKGRRT